MGRRLNIAQPAVISTVLTPLTEHLDIVASDALLQWYYNITQEYKPDRTITPLFLTPVVKVYDPEMKQVYNHPNITTSTQWSVLQSNGTWSAIYMTQNLAEDLSELDSDYIMLEDYTLLVRKNVLPTQSVTLKLSLVYEDPRLAGKTYTLEKRITLSTNEDTTILFPTLGILDPPLRTFDVLREPVRDVAGTNMLKGLKTFTAQAKMGASDVTASTYFVWYIKEDGTEMLAENHPCYVSGQNTSVLSVDMMFSEKILVICRSKANAEASSLYPGEAVATYAWKPSEMTAMAVAMNGGVVDSEERNVAFSTIINLRGHEMTAEEKEEHFQLNWKRKKANSSTTTVIGKGLQASVAASDLRDYADIGTQVFADVLLKGPYRLITHNGAVVTYSGTVTTADGTSVTCENAKMYMRE